MRKHLFLFLLFSFLSILIWAQVPRIDTYKMLKNRKDIEVNAIFQDSAGFIWIGTDDGLIKFDGIDFKLFTQNDSLADNTIVSINQDREGMLWIGHKNGKISLSNGQKFWRFQPEEGLSSKQIASFYFDNRGIPWFTTFGEGVYFYTGEHRKRLYNLSTDDGLIDNNVYCMVQDSNGLIYFGTDFGISIYNPENKQFIDEITMKDGLPDNIVKDLKISDQVLWIGMEEGGICTMELDSKKLSRINGWEFGSLNSFICTAPDEIWVSTQRKGIVKCNYDEQGKSWYSVYTKDNGLADNRTNIIYLDREKNIWFGTRKGLSIRRNNNIEFLDAKSGVDLSPVFSITVDSLGKMWIATAQRLSIIQRDAMGKIYQTSLFENTSFNQATFISLYTDVKGFIWAGTYGYGVFKINPKTLDYEQFNSSKGLVNDNVISITGDSENIWFSTLGGGVSKYCLAQPEVCFQSFTVENGLPSNYIYSIFIDKKSQVWLATDGGGVCCIINDSVSMYHNALIDSIGKVVYSITQDNMQNMWFAIKDQGLVRIKKNKALHLRETEGLKSNSVQSIGIDNQGNLVSVSNLGIQIYYIKSKVFESLGEAEGVAYQDPNLNALYRDGAGNCWIGTANGIIKLLASQESQQIQPLISITSKSLFFNELHQDIHKFRYNQNHLSFKYNAFWYQSPEELTYRYRLNGNDFDWNPETNSRMQTYSNLAPGKYTFEVEVKHPNGTWVASPKARYHFVIKPPFWKTTWFILSMIVFLILGIYLFIQARTRKLIKDKELLEDEVKRRTAEIQKQKEEIEAQRDEIEAQRNHVIEQRDKIELQNKDIVASIQYASRIQKAVLPPMDNFKNLLGDTFVFFKPRDMVSGDFYYLNAKGDQVVVAAADCTGHGVPGAFMSILGISLLNQIIGQAPTNFDAGYLLTQLRGEIKKALRQTGKEGEAKDGMDISLCVYSRKAKNLHYAGAFNPLILVRNKELIEYNADKMPIGVFIKEVEQFTNHSVAVEPGDMLYMYSDGFQDQFGGEQNRKFLPKRLKQLLVDNSNVSLEEQHNKLNETFLKWIGNHIQIDDVLVMGIRV